MLRRTLTTSLWLLISSGLVGEAAEPAGDAPAPAPASTASAESLADADRLAREATALSDHGQPRAALAPANQALDIRRRSLGVEHPLYAASLDQLGGLLTELARYDEARQALDKALELRVRLLGAQDPQTAATHEHLADLLSCVGDFAAAREHYQKSLDIRRLVVGPDRPETGRSLGGLGRALVGLEKSDEARPCFEQALSIAEQASGPERPDTAQALFDLGDWRASHGDAAAARACFERSLAIRRKLQGERHPETAGVMIALARALNNAGEPGQARALDEQALAIMREAYGEQHPAVANALAAIGGLSFSTQDYQGALPWLEQALALREQLREEAFPETNRVRFMIGLCYEELGDTRRARPYLEGVEQYCRQHYGPQSPNTGAALLALGRLLSEAREFAAAAKCYQESLAIQRLQLAGDRGRLADSLLEFSSMLSDLGDYRGARSLAEEALKNYRQTVGQKHLDTARALVALGDLLVTMNDYVAARPCLEQSLAIRRELLPAKDPRIAESLNSLGLLLDNIENRAAARRCYQEALAIRKASLGLKHAKTAESLSNVGMTYLKDHEYPEALRYFEQAQAIQQEVLGPRHSQTITTKENIGETFVDMEQYDKALPYLEEALRVRQELWGPRHYLVGFSANNLGLLCQRMGKHDLARPLLEQALAITLEINGDTHEHTAASYATLAAADELAGRWSEAAQNFDRSRRVVRRWIARVLPALSEQEQLAFLEEEGGSFSGAVSFAVSRKNRDQAIPSLSAAWLLNRKGIAQETLAERGRTAHDSRNPELAAVLGQLAELRRELANVALTGAEPGPRAESRAARIQDLEEREQQLSRQIAQLGGHSLQSQSWVEVDALRAALPADSVLVDIARYVYWDSTQQANPQKAWIEGRYAAWIVPPAGRGDVQLVELGTAGLIEPAVTAAQRAMADAMGSPKEPGLIQRNGEAEAERALKKSLAPISALALRPILQAISALPATPDKPDKIRRLILCPDRSLWLVPWSALPLDDGRYAVEEYEFPYLVSGRDLLPDSADNSSAIPAAAEKTPTDKLSANSRREKALTSKPIIMADPDFDLSAAESLAATRAVLRSAAPAGNEPRFFSDLRSAIPKVDRLPGTLVEAQAIAPKLTVYAGAEPTVYAGAYALESVFKAIQRPRALVLSTHGFFLDADQTAGGKIENPLLRCGLLLAGCNAPTRAAGGEDGVLTGMEIVGADLRGTDLVVLSACETGLGQERNGEGVSGLRQAFQLAGARAVVATLWQVPDSQSAKIMTDFFTNLAVGQSKSAALRDAQLKMIEARRANRGAAHPFFWAAFTLTGN